VRAGWDTGATPYLFLVPFAVLFLVFRVLPLAYGLFLSLTNARLGRPTAGFVGLDNYAQLLSDRLFQLSLINTGRFALEATVPVLGVPLLLALALNRGVPLLGLLRSAFFLPFTLSVVTLGLIWLWVLDPILGLLNYYLRLMGFAPPAWTGNGATAMWAIVLATVWWVAGYYLVLYLAALQDIPRHLYEAAELDGAGPVRRFWSITVPLLRPIMLLVLVVHVIGAFQLFGQVFVMTGGGPANATRTVVQHIYETGFRGQFLLGPAAAMSWVLFVFIVIFSVLQFRLLGGHTEY
jgi:multiple sugar transport system permease protein